MASPHRRLLALVFAAAIAVASIGVPPAGAAIGVEASFELGAPPAWQTAEQRTVEGSWVRHSSPVIADVDPVNGNGPEIAVGATDGKLYVLRASGGRLELLWSRDVGTYIDSSPAVADLDGDGFREVLVGAGNTNRTQNSGVHVFGWNGSNHRRWVTPDVPGFSNGVFSTPAVGNVTGDGRPEVVFGAFNHHVYVKDAAGNDAPGWVGGKFMHDTVWSSAALADVDGDGDLEIAIGSDLGGGAPVFGCPRETRGLVSLFDGDGTMRPGWPRCMDTPIWSSPAVQDVTGDGVLDVIVGTNNLREEGANVGDAHRVHAFSTAGSPLWSTPLAAGARIFASPAVGDVTGDGRPEVAVATIEGNVAGRVWLLDAMSGRVLWSRSDGGDGSCCIFMGSPVIADVAGDARPDVVVTGGDGRLHVWGGDGTALLDLPLGRTMFNSPAVGDVDRDGRPEVVAASAVAGSDPSKGKVWVVGTDRSGGAPWGMFRHGPDRRGAVGSGTLGSGAPPPPAPPRAAAPATQSPTRTRRPAATSPASPEATSSPTASPTRTPRGTPAPRAQVARLSTDDGDGTAARWIALAALVAALGAAIGGRRLGVL